MTDKQLYYTAVDTVIRYAEEQGIVLRRMDFVLDELSQLDVFQFCPQNHEISSREEKLYSCRQCRQVYHRDNCTVSLIKPDETGCAKSVVVFVPFAGRWCKLVKKAQARFLKYENAQREKGGISFVFPVTQLESFSSIASVKSKFVPCTNFCPEAVVDDFLRHASNSRNTRLFVVAAFQKQKSLTDIAELLQSKYHGGAGIKSLYGEFSVWYAEDGLHIAKGRTARYTENARVISWIEAAKRIEHLVLTGVFATTEELETAEIHERVFLAEQLWHLRGELTAQAKGQGILSVLSDYRKNGFPKDNERLSDKLKDSSFRGRLLAEYDVFLKAYEENRKILRFHYHDVYALRDKIVDLDLPRQGFHSEMKEFSAVQMFITEDEIEATLTRGSNVEGSKGRICRFLTEIHTAKEKVDFLRNEFGISGSSHAVSGYGWIYSDGKGLRLQKPACSALKLIWSDVSKRYENIIENDRYFTSEEKERYHKLLSESEGSK